MPPHCIPVAYFYSPGPSECEGPWPVSFTYTDNGRRTRTTWARGAWREHAYNDRNLVSVTTYSGDVTPSVAYTYADSGKVASATLSDGTAYAYAYDDRLLVTNETATIGQDDYVLERIAFPNGSSRVCEYFWGPDMSGAEQGAGGVGGLLAVSMDGVFYIPCYDHNGDIVRYVSESSAVAAEYVYDPYGGIAEEGGSIAEQFTFGFSTKVHDREIGLVAYQRRFYRPAIGRWIHRDPIEEEGGENLYGFCGNAPSTAFELLGLSWSLHRDPLNNWAIAIPSDEYDTFSTLAELVRLDINEIESWSAGTIKRDAVPVVGCKYKVPNLMVFYTSRRKFLDISYTVSKMQIVVETLSIAYEREGYKCEKYLNHGNKSDFENAWGLEGLTGVFYAGHGRDSGLLVDVKHNEFTFPNDVSPKFKLSIGAFYACDSDSDIGYGRWRDHVAINAGGIYVGYSGLAFAWTHSEDGHDEQK